MKSKHFLLSTDLHDEHYSDIRPAKSSKKPHPFRHKLFEVKQEEKLIKLGGD